MLQAHREIITRVANYYAAGGARGEMNFSEQIRNFHSSFTMYSGEKNNGGAI